MNTTDLIREWSMDGASSDVDDSFESLVDINAQLSEREQELLEPMPTPAPLLLKSADEDDWQPIQVAVSTG